MKTTEQHMEAVQLMSKLAARTAQVKALRKQRKLLFDSCQQFITDCDCDSQDEGGDWGSIEWLGCVSGAIENIKSIMKKVKADY